MALSLHLSGADLDKADSFGDIISVYLYLYLLNLFVFISRFNHFVCRSETGRAAKPTLHLPGILSRLAKEGDAAAT